jgi:hypothetical protein
MPSSIRPVRDSTPRVRALPEEVMLVDWPLRDQPVSASLALTLVAGAAWLAIWATENSFAGTLVAVALAVTLWRTWLPVRYQLGSGGIVQSVLGWRRRIAWSAIRHYEVRPDGVILSPDVAVPQMASGRGLYLHFGSQREAVLAQLDYYLTGRGAAGPGSTHGSRQ